MKTLYYVVCTWKDTPRQRRPWRQRFIVIASNADEAIHMAKNEKPSLDDQAFSWTAEEKGLVYRMALDRAP